MEQLGATDDQVPMLMMLELQKDAKYVKGKAKPEDLTKFVEDYKVSKGAAGVDAAVSVSEKGTVLRYVM